MLLEISDLILTSNAKSIVDFFSEDPVFAGQLAWYSAQLLNSRWQFTALVEASEDANDLSRSARGLSVANGLDIVVQKKIDGMRGIDDRSVDIVYAIGLLQTVPQYEHLRELLAEISRVLMPGGVILLDFYSLNHAAISTVARGDDWNLVDTLQHIVLYCDPASYGPVSAPPMYENRKLWQIDELDDLLEASGFSLERFHPIDPVSAWMTSESWNKVRDAGEEGLATYFDIRRDYCVKIRVPLFLLATTVCRKET